jgi:hypothetical protein
MDLLICALLKGQIWRSVPTTEGALSAQAGFRLERIYPTRTAVSVIEGVPV